MEITENRAKCHTMQRGLIMSLLLVSKISLGRVTLTHRHPYMWASEGIANEQMRWHQSVTTLFLRTNSQAENQCEHEHTHTWQK